MLIVIQSCQWTVNLSIDPSPKGQSIITKLVKIIINRLYFADCSYHSFLLLPINGLSDNFPLFTIYIFCLLCCGLSSMYMPIEPKFSLLACVLILLLNRIAAFCQSPKLSSNGWIVIDRIIEKRLGQRALIMDKLQGGQFF